MNLSYFEKVLSNVDILIPIYNLLDFGDQLRLSQVNDQLKSVFELFIWRENSTALQIFDQAPDIVITNETGVNRRCLQQPKDIDRFLLAYADSVRDLTLYKSICDKFSVDLLQFRNLRSLSFYNISISPDSLKSIVRNCDAGNLQELNLIHCHINIYKIINNTLIKLVNLKILQIVHNLTCRIKPYQLLKILSMPKLEILKLTNEVQFSCGVDSLCLELASNLKKLDIKVTQLHPLKWLSFEKLLILNLSIRFKVTEHDLLIIAEKCKILDKLTLANINFINITSFALPPKVTELSLLRCSGLTYITLKQLLTKFQIQKFCSRNNSYDGQFIDFKPSPLIQYMEHDFIHMREFKAAYENNTQLKELIWNVAQLGMNTDVPRGVTIGNCVNLLRLDVPCISVHGLAQLSSLQSLTLTRPWYLIEWNYIVDVLKLCTLEELKLQCFWERTCNLVNDPPPVAFLTNISRLTLTLHMLKSSMGFWLELFCRNKQMTLICSPISCREYLYCIRELINHEKFPKTLKTIDICCFTMDCNELRRNHNDIWQKLPKWILFVGESRESEEIPSDYLNGTLPNRVILSWK